jgi:hypothetical protein
MPQSNNGATASQHARIGASLAALIVLSVGGVVALTSSGTSHHVDHAVPAQHTARAASATPTRAATLTPSAIQSAVDAATKGGPVSITAITTRGGVEISRDVAVVATDGSMKDTYFDGSTPLTQSGVTSAGTPVFVDYTAKQWYTPTGSSVATNTSDWIAQDLQSGLLSVARDSAASSDIQLTGRDPYGSAESVTLDARTLLPIVARTVERGGTVTQTYVWGSQATASTRANLSAATVVTPPAGFRHLSVAPATSGQPGTG